MIPINYSFDLKYPKHYHPDNGDLKRRQFCLIYHRFCSLEILQSWVKCARNAEISDTVDQTEIWMAGREDESYHLTQGGPNFAFFALSATVFKLIRLKVFATFFTITFTSNYFFQKSGEIFKAEYRNNGNR